RCRGYRRIGRFRAGSGGEDRAVRSDAGCLLTRRDGVPRGSGLVWNERGGPKSATEIVGVGLRRLVPGRQLHLGRQEREREHRHEDENGSERPHGKKESVGRNRRRNQADLRDFSIVSPSPVSGGAKGWGRSR